MQRPSGFTPAPLGSVNPQLILTLARDNKAELIEAMVANGCPVGWANQVGSLLLSVMDFAILLRLKCDLSQIECRLA